MRDLTRFPVTHKWPATYPERIQLYYQPTPNGLKISIALEELELAWEAHRVSFDDKEQYSSEFLSLSPNNKIPAILDPDGPDGHPIGLFESAAILIYLAEKTGRLIPMDARKRYECLQWLMFQISGIGPFFGQLGHFHKFARDKTQDEYALKRYLLETQRLLKVLETRLQNRRYLMDDEFTIADIATFPWINTLLGFYEAGEMVGIKNLPNVERYWHDCLQRPGVIRGMKTND